MVKRGNGIEVKTKYKYVKQPNGRFTILDVPVFAPFFRKKENEKGEKIVVKATEKGLKKAVGLFRKRKQSGYYPTIHRLHQDLYSNEERDHLGYLDNVYVKNGVMFADCAELSEDTIKKIKDMKLCNRSLEYLPDENEIISLALLESKPPHHKFPLLALEDEPIMFGGYSARVEQFTQRAKSIIQFGEMEMAKKKKIQACGGVKPVQMEDDMNIEEMDEKDEVSEEMEEDLDIDKKILALLENQGEVLNSIAQGCERLGAFLDSMEDGDEEELEDEEQMSEDYDEEEVEDEDKKLSSEDPSSVALSQQFKYMNKAILQLNRELKDIKGERATNQFHQELKAMCEENPSINFAAEKKYLEQFSDNKSKRAHLNYVRTNARSFQGSSVPGRIAKGANLEQFSKEDAHIQAVAKQAKIDYRDSISQFDIAAAQQFSQMWKNEDEYVTRMVQLEKDKRQ